MTTVLAVAIGLLFMYLILSLIVSAINEGFASLTDRRANFLRKGVENLLGPKLTDRFYEHGLISALTRKGVRFHKKPAYISRETFGTALLDVIPEASNPDSNPDPPESSEPEKSDLPALAEVKARVEAIEDGERGGDGKKGEAQDLKEALQAFARESAVWAEFKERLERWFDEAMERVSGWYRRRTRIMLWAIALVLVVVLNADTINVARVLWLDPTVRSAAEAAAQEAVQDEGAGQPPAVDEPADVVREAATAITRLEEVGLPLRWSEENTPDDPAGWLLKFVGLIITGFALTFGAPFWFDILKKVVGVRASGPPPPEQAEPEKEKSK
jgi:hypothetical protein